MSDSINIFKNLLSIWRSENGVIIILSLSKMEFFLLEGKAKYWGKSDVVSPSLSQITNLPAWKFHRLDGPAEIHTDSGNKFYWVNGVWCQNQEEYKKKQQKFISRQ